MATHTPLQEAMYTTARPDVVSMIAGKPERVLDVGCSDGSLGAALKERYSAEVWGIEYDEGFAAIAAERVDRVVRGDALIHVGELADADETFDTVVCADVLEHVVHPDLVLAQVRRLIRSDGQVIVSLPNVRFHTTFTNLIIRGRWPRNDRGVHDRTHLRWFTDLNAREMFEEAGFRVDGKLTNYRITDLPQPRKNARAKYVAWGPWRDFFAYQFVYRIRPA